MKINQLINRCHSENICHGKYNTKLCHGDMPLCHPAMSPVDNTSPGSANTATATYGVYPVLHYKTTKIGLSMLYRFTNEKAD